MLKAKTKKKKHELSNKCEMEVRTNVPEKWVVLALIHYTNNWNVRPGLRKFTSVCLYVVELLARQLMFRMGSKSIKCLFGFEWNMVKIYLVLQHSANKKGEIDKYVESRWYGSRLSEYFFDFRLTSLDIFFPTNVYYIIHHMYKKRANYLHIPIKVLWAYRKRHGTGRAVFQGLFFFFNSFYLFFVDWVTDFVHKSQ